MHRDKGMTAASTPTTVFDLITERRQRDPGSLTILDADGQALAAAALEEGVRTVGALLAGHGLGPGDRVALVVPPGAAGAVWLLGVAAYAVAVPLNPDLTADDFRRLFVRLRVKALVTAIGLGSAALGTARALDITVIATDSDEWRNTASSAVPGRPNDAQDAALILLTSGTTAAPKVVTASSAEMIGKSANAAALLGLGPADRCLNVMPLFHGNGIYDGLLAPLISGGSTICHARFETGLFFSALKDLGPTWYTASFAINLAVLSAVTRDGAAIDGHRLRFIRSGSGAISTAAVTALEAAFRIPVIVTYALTETGIVAVSPMTPADRKPGIAVRPRAGTIAIGDEGGCHLPAGEPGEILVKHPYVTPAYEGDAEATAAADAGDGWFRTGDFGCLDADGSLTVTGRLKEMINRGGEKIAPAEIEAALEGHPAVRESVAFALDHPTLGEDVAAAVVLRPDAAADTDGIRDFAAQRLAPFKVPKRIVIVDAIPRGQTGKPQRLRLAGDLKDLAAADEELTETETVLARIWAEEIGCAAVGPDDDFFVLGGDSMQAAHVFLRIEEELGYAVSIAELLGAGTVRRLAEVLDRDRDSRSLVTIRAEGHLRPFFCVHGGGGNVLAFRELAAHLDPARPFYGLQARGVDGKDGPVLEIAEMAAAYIDEIRRVQPEGPYLLGGYSFGGMVAHAMAVQLQAAGERVAALALLDSRSAKTIHSVLPRHWWHRHHDRLRTLSPRTAVPFMADRARSALRLARSVVTRRLYALRLRRQATRPPPRPTSGRIQLRRSNIARSRHRPQRFDGRAVLYRTVGGHAAPDRAYAEWPKFIAGGVETRIVPGHHRSMLAEPAVRDLARALDVYLSSAEEPTISGR